VAGAVRSEATESAVGVRSIIVSCALPIAYHEARTVPKRTALPAMMMVLDERRLPLAGTVSARARARCGATTRLIGGEPSSIRAWIGCVAVDAGVVAISMALSSGGVSNLAGNDCGPA